MEGWPSARTGSRRRNVVTWRVGILRAREAQRAIQRVRWGVLLRARKVKSALSGLPRSGLLCAWEPIRNAMSVTGRVSARTGNTKRHDVFAAGRLSTRTRSGKRTLLSATGRPSERTCAACKPSGQFNTKYESKQIWGVRNQSSSEFCGRFKRSQN